MGSQKLFQLRGHAHEGLLHGFLQYKLFGCSASFCLLVSCCLSCLLQWISVIFQRLLADEKRPCDHIHCDFMVFKDSEADAFYKEEDCETEEPVVLMETASESSKELQAANPVENGDMNKEWESGESANEGSLEFFSDVHDIKIQETEDSEALALGTVAINNDGGGMKSEMTIGDFSGAEPDRGQRGSTNSEESDIIESEKGRLLEHLKLDLRRTRNGKLPTILEDSESRKMADDMKPLKIDEKLKDKDHIEEIQKFYKIYADKMRKLDILNGQTLHALEFLRLKDQAGQEESSRQCELGKSNAVADPATPRFIRELQRDLEMVYVGQMCLSWEILHWQYRKAREMQGSDFHGVRAYNQVAGKLHQFQLLLQRFLENEAFQGPRVQAYTRRRCALQGLLQVPAIRDDGTTDRSKESAEKEGEHGIPVSISKLTETLMESMRCFWEFLRADRDGAWSDPKRVQPRALPDVQKMLRKKERQLKDVVGSGNCLVRRFQKHREGVGSWAVIARVEMKLVSRVVRMPSVTEGQLGWCAAKLSSIRFGRRKMIRMEPSFQVFPW